ncbi:ABC transporter ATP-binding protein [Paludibacterium purpuratum]|uniref:Cu-processing system ATP-binding protein n=1 Tax=Paludibacterium purpuratum TaxID=1144873 RepID=A0A4R7BCA0_9NEIS|nr:ABC transporter ATP-binding protein [Paludibacterium purpuratum]TDR81535.1 Cu-processing system ATP-binding protein [Paludibacterium purpuratum]
MISLSQVCKSFGAIQALQSVDLRISAGEIFGLIGHNGAGKSTLFNIMLGLIRADSGQVAIDGQTIDAHTLLRQKRHIGYLPENIALYDNLTGLETLAFFARLKHAAPAQCHELLEQVGLSASKFRKVREYSKGMKQRLGFAQALLGQPRILFLDEPTNGLDPEGIREFYQTLRQCQQQGTTIVITSHILSEIQQRVDRMAILRDGRVQFAGSLADLRKARNPSLSIFLTLPPHLAEEVHAQLTELLDLPVSLEGQQIRVICPTDRKLSLMQQLTALSLPLLDMAMHEASLEELLLATEAFRHD